MSHWVDEVLQSDPPSAEHWDRLAKMAEDESTMLRYRRDDPVNTIVSRELGTWIAEQLNIDPMDVLGINIDLQPGEIAKVDVRLMLSDPDGKLVPQLKHYELKEIPDFD